MKDKIIPLLTLLATCAYPCAFMYLQNVGECNFTDIIIPFVAFLFVAILVMLVCTLLFRNLEKAAIFASIFMIIFMNFNLILNGIQKIFSGLESVHLLVVYIVLAVILLIVLKKNEWDVGSGCAIIGIVFGTLIIVNLVPAVPKIISNLSPVEELTIEQNAKITENKPNIYYMIFDEYGGTENLQYYYEFDNKELEEFLTDAGFSYSHTSHNSESINTVDILPNILNLQYVTEINGMTKKNMGYTENPLLYQFFDDMGYQINMVNHMNTLRAEGCNVISNKKQETLGEVTANLISQSLLINILNWGKEKQNTEKSANTYANNLTEQLNAIKYSWKEAKSQPTFTVGYIQCPHETFIFDEKGKILSSDDWRNWEDKGVYLGQLKYLNKWIEEMVTEIQINDPNAVIVLQSDHGARYALHQMELYDGSEDNVEKDMEIMQNVLNCVYLGNNKNVDIEGMSGINTWRTILNTLYGTEYEMLPQPEGYVFE